MRTHQCHRLGDRKGAVMPLVALCLTALLGVAALTIDIGRIYRERRNAQAAADEAAEAAGIELAAKYAQNRGVDKDGAARASALELAKINSFDASEVTVNIPPASGAFAGKIGYVEVVINSPIPRSFSAIYAKNDLMVKARAIAAGALTPSLASVLVLHPTRKDPLKLKGKNSALEVAGDVIVNSSNKRAVKVSKKSQIVAENLLVTGGIDKKSKGLIDATVSTGVAPTPDPLASLPLPAKGTDRKAGDFKSMIGTQEVFDLQPGCYKELKFDNNDLVRMVPGVYYVEGEVSFKDTSSLSGSGVMIYTAGNKGMKFKSKGDVTLSPPTSGTYKGVTLFQHGGSKTKMEFKNDKELDLAGIIYAPNSEVKFKNVDLEFDEDWEAESDEYDLEDDGGVSVAGALSASIICRKLSIEKGSRVQLRGADINVEVPIRGLLE
jgi:putative Flp pilus-assembly TadE/G-like protein